MERHELKRQPQRGGTRKTGGVGLSGQRQVHEDVAGDEGGETAEHFGGGHRESEEL